MYFKLTATPKGAIFLLKKVKKLIDNITCPRGVYPIFIFYSLQGGLIHIFIYYIGGIYVRGCIKKMGR